MGQLAWLDVTPFKHRVEIVSVNLDGESQGWQPAVTDHSVDHGQGQVQVPARLFRIKPIGLAVVHLR